MSGARQLNLDALKQKLVERVVECLKCKDTEKPPVPPEGDVYSSVMIVGRNPGRVELREGRPFVGPGGQLLDEELKRVGLRRQQLWVTNLCLCYTEKDREPTKEEIEACLPFLKFQIKMIKPKLIVALGKPTSQALLNMPLSWKEVHGKFFKQDDHWIMPCTHPGQALRGHRPALRYDFNELRYWLKIHLPNYLSF